MGRITFMVGLRKVLMVGAVVAAVTEKWAVAVAVAVAAPAAATTAAAVAAVTAANVVPCGASFRARACCATQFSV